MKLNMNLEEYLENGGLLSNLPLHFIKQEDGSYFDRELIKIESMNNSIFILFYKGNDYGLTCSGRNLYIYISVVLDPKYIIKK